MTDEKRHCSPRTFNDASGVPRGTQARFFQGWRCQTPGIGYHDVTRLGGASATGHEYGTVDTTRGVMVGAVYHGNVLDTDAK